MDLDELIRDYTRPRRPELPPGVQKVTRDVPTRAPDLAGDVLAPVLIALFSGFIVFVSVGVVSLAFRWSVKWPLLACGLSLALIWFWHLSKGWDRLIWAFEEITGADVDQDGQVGQPSEITITIERPDDPNVVRYLHIPERLFPKVPTVAQRLLDGTPFSEGALCGSGRPLSRTEFHQLRDLFFNRGICEWQDPDHHTLGIEFSPYGRSVIRQLAELSTTPPRIRTPRGPDVLPAYTGEGRGLDE